MPLDEGGLTGDISSETKFEKGDFRNSYFTPDRLKELDTRVGKLQKIVIDSEEVESLVEMALRFILSLDEVSTVIPGMRKIKHVEENTSFSDKGKLSGELLEELRKHLWIRNFYGGNS